MNRRVGIRHFLNIAGVLLGVGTVVGGAGFDIIPSAGADPFRWHDLHAQIQFQTAVGRSTASLIYLARGDFANDLNKLRPVDTHLGSHVGGSRHQLGGDGEAPHLAAAT
ncbi:MAG: hypothetical protein VX733_00540 [Candidatus Latescibacterota bacterium]|nr:hypothetical protein [Candidatus Latescibacterota bacterium]